MNPADRPQVSVIIPTYNRWPLVLEAVDSALAQEAPPTEIVVVDDGSTDGTSTRLGAARPSVRIIRQENKGRAVARNMGINVAKGEYVAFLDADDVHEPWHLSQFKAAVNDCAGVAAFAAPGMLWDPLSDRRRPLSRPRFLPRPLQDAALVGTVFPVQGLIVPRVVAGELGFPDDRSLERSEDWVFLVRITRSLTVCPLRTPSVRIREHSGRSIGDVDRAVRARDRATAYLLASETLDQREAYLVQAGCDRYAASRLYEAGRMQKARSRLAAVRATLGFREGWLWTWRLWLQTWLGHNLSSRLRKLKRALQNQRVR